MRFRNVRANLYSILAIFLSFFNMKHSSRRLYRVTIYRYNYHFVEKILTTNEKNKRTLTESTVCNKNASVFSFFFVKTFIFSFIFSFWKTLNNAVFCSFYDYGNQTLTIRIKENFEGVRSKLNCL